MVRKYYSRRKKVTYNKFGLSHIKVTQKWQQQRLNAINRIMHMETDHKNRNNLWLGNELQKGYYFDEYQKILNSTAINKQQYKGVNYGEF